MGLVELGHAIKVARLVRGLKQTELSELTGLSVSYISQIETGQRNPSFGTVMKIAAALTVPTSYLVQMAEGHVALVDGDMSEAMRVFGVIKEPV